MRIKIAKVASIDNYWWYMGCKQCLQKLKKDQGMYTNPTCTQPKAFPRYFREFIHLLSDVK